nr:tetraacyldisaccharide 4'-kinase [Hoylesella enoeca]
MRTEGDLIRINEWLLPLSWLYGFGVRVRNRLFDMGILKSQAFDIPVIAVGNITVGGSGKTPHIEYLVRLLKDRAKTAVLSRGYKRQTRGYLLADGDATMQQIGDEPYQMKTKFADIYVAVDKKRTRGIQRLTTDSATSDVEVILLDDAFQHRYVKPGINILLVDYHRLIIYDKLLPAGRLREPKEGKSRADIVIVTKCPKDLKPMEFRVLVKAMNLFPYQDLFFTTIDYEPLTPVFGGTKRSLESVSPQENVLLLTGIASPKQMMFDLKPYCHSITPLTFGDHHLFTEKDIRHINETFAAMPSPKLVITTEKDATRLETISGLSDELRQHLFALPIRIHFMLDQEENFNNKIINYVRKNSRDSILVKRKDDNKAGNGHHSGDRPRPISFRDH